MRSQSPPYIWAHVVTTCAGSCVNYLTIDANAHVVCVYVTHARVFLL